MSSPISTALIGAGVVAICFALASLKGHHLLMAFAVTGLLFGIRAWLHSRTQNGRAASSSLAGSPREKLGRSSGQNIYQFPPQPELRAYDSGA